jgi:hypothetical protein
VASPSGESHSTVPVHGAHARFFDLTECRRRSIADPESATRQGVCWLASGRKPRVKAITLHSDTHNSTCVWLRVFLCESQPCTEAANRLQHCTATPSGESVSSCKRRANVLMSIVYTSCSARAAFRGGCCADGPGRGAHGHSCLRCSKLQRPVGPTEQLTSRSTSKLNLPLFLSAPPCAHQCCQTHRGQSCPVFTPSATGRGLPILLAAAPSRHHA